MESLGTRLVQKEIISACALVLKRCTRTQSRTRTSSTASSPGLPPYDIGRPSLLYRGGRGVVG